MNKYELAKQIYEFLLIVNNDDDDNILLLEMENFHQVLEGDHDRGCEKTPRTCTKCEAEYALSMAEWILEKNKK